MSDWAAMARKTAIKQLSKWLPMSSEFAAAVTLDGAVRTDVNPLVDVQPEFIDGDVDDAPQAAEQPIETVYASTDQLAKLGEIRKAEKYDEASWRDFVLAATNGAEVERDEQLTLDQAQMVIDLFGQESR